VAVFLAAGIDKLDGFYARKYGEPSWIGRQLDSFLDSFIYLIPGGILFYVDIGPNPMVGAFVGFVVIAFGGLRLIRYAEEGLGEEGDVSFYRGLTVVHINTVVVANYLLIQYTPIQFGSVQLGWTGWLAAFSTILFSPLLITERKSYKSLVGHLAAAGFGVVAIILVLNLELVIF